MQTSFYNLDQSSLLWRLLSGKWVESLKIQKFSHLSKMGTKNKKLSNVFMEPLTFQVCGEEPVHFPAGHFGSGPQESQSTPEPDWVESDTLVLEEEQTEFPPCFDYDDDERFLEHCDDFPTFDEPSNCYCDNANLYRVYDVFIHTSPNPSSCRQFYVLQDFDYGPNKEILINRSRFAVVALLNVMDSHLAQI